LLPRSISSVAKQCRFEVLASLEAPSFMNTSSARAGPAARIDARLAAISAVIGECTRPAG